MLKDSLEHFLNCKNLSEEKIDSNKAAPNRMGRSALGTGAQGETFTEKRQRKVRK